MRFSTLFFAIAATASLTSCSSHQWYDAGQEWKKNECNRIIDMQERNRCASSNKASYDDYKRQSEAAKAAK